MSQERLWLRLSVQVLSVVKPPMPTPEGIDTGLNLSHVPASPLEVQMASLRAVRTRFSQVCFNVNPPRGLLFESKTGLNFS